MAAILAAAALLGNWFLAELKTARAQRKPWYAPYVSLPGILIIIAVLIPVLLRIMRW
jgi:hypothetical protein